MSYENNEIKELENVLPDNPSEIIKNYSELIARYEDYAKLTATMDVIECSFVGIQQYAGVVTRFSLIAVDTGLKVYVSGKYTIYEYCKIDFEALGFATGTKFYLKAEVEAGKDCTCTQILKYVPDTRWALYDLKGTTFHTKFVNHQ